MATPYQPGMIRRKGAPCGTVSGSPFSAQASRGSGLSAFSSVMLRPNCWFSLKVCCRKTTSDSPRSVPRKTTSRAFAPTPACFKTSRRGTPVKRPHEDRDWKERGLLPEHSYPATSSVDAHLAQFRQRQVHGLVHHAAQLQPVGVRVDLRLIEVLQDEKLVLRDGEAVDRPDVKGPPRRPGATG